MPRTSRFDVVFNALGTQWIAHFTHSHNDAGLHAEFPNPRGDGYVASKVRHVTVCHLTNNLQQEPMAYQGEAYCSMKDSYKWRRGIKTALIRAVKLAGFEEKTKEHGAMLNSFFKELGVREQR